jgi:hypothetical protein
VAMVRGAFWLLWGGCLCLSLMEGGYKQAIPNHFQ